MLIWWDPPCCPASNFALQRCAPHILLRLVLPQVLQQEEARYNSADLNIAYKMSVDEYQRLCPFAEALEENWGKPPGAASVCRQTERCQLCHCAEALSCRGCRCQFWWPLSCRRSSLSLLQLGAMLQAGSPFTWNTLS